jgi:hypothetical protein
LHAKSYLGKTKLYNYSKVKDPKNPPGIEIETQKLDGDRISKLSLVFPRLQTDLPLHKSPKS